MTDDLLNLAILAEAVPVQHETVTGAYDAAGKWVEGTRTWVTVQATVQPAAGRQLMDLPEGIRTEAKYFLWSEAAIVVGEIVVYLNQRYKVLYTWPRPADSFTRAALGLTND